ncbi:MAG: magnesium transporter CorA family protein [Erysipelotrichia bacterium]|nr:magnesium transporter CorA family protein [Erysipelotrichia bacterium]NCC53947.1 magnesium transporter CorA family protein [Erysipelotrichia bacterium]
MLNFYKTIDQNMVTLDAPEAGCWISVISPTPEEISYLINEIGIMSDFVKASLDEEESPHIDADDNQTLIVVDYPSQEKDEPDNENDALTYMTLPMGVVFIDNYIVTISLYDNMTLEELRKGMIKGAQTNLRTRFLLLMLLKISQRYLIYLKRIDRLSSRTEKKLHQSMRNKELIQLLGLEKSLVYFSTSLKTDEMIINKILRGNVVKLYEEDQDILEDVLIELKQAIEMCNIYSGILSGTMDAFASVISNNLNIVMKVLTSITIVMAIPNIIFSFYGMNVTGLPFPTWWVPIVIATVSCLIAFYLLVKKDMFH